MAIICHHDDSHAFFVIDGVKTDQNASRLTHGQTVSPLHQSNVDLSTPTSTSNPMGLEHPPTKRT